MKALAKAAEIIMEKELSKTIDQGKIQDVIREAIAMSFEAVIECRDFEA